MFKNGIKRFLAMILSLCMMLTPVAAIAAEIETENQNEIVDENGTEEIVPFRADDTELFVADYASFLENLKTLEYYAADYSGRTGEDAGKLVLNFVRCGVQRYTEGLWNVLAGDEIVGFTEYVRAQDEVNGTTAMALRNIKVKNFYLPNGNQVDFGHMFGSMNISYIAPKSSDLASWAGDIADLIFYSKGRGNVPEGTIDEMAEYVLNNCFGVDADDAFGMDDFYGDLDAFYLIAQMRKGVLLSTAMEGYFVETLSDRVRSEFFLNNRFDFYPTDENDTTVDRAEVRAMIYNTYKSDIGIQVLEGDDDYQISEEHELREACCYAFADYVFNQAGDLLIVDPIPEEPDPEDPDDPVDPDNPVDPDDPGEDEEDTGLAKNQYYKVFSRTESVIAPGVNQYTEYAITADNKQIVYYVAEVDVSRDDLSVHANYKDNDPLLGWGMSRVEDQMTAAKERHSDPSNPDFYVENYTPVVGVNGDFYDMSNGKPSGALVMEGVQYSPVGHENFFAILDDGSAVIGTPSEWAQYEGRIVEAIGGSIMLVKDGKSVVASTSTYYNSRASRTCVGIDAEGKVILMVLDGRQEPFSAGGSSEEIAQIMVEAGCVIAMNLDGGGSTTFVAKAAGSDVHKVMSSPSDGYARSVSSSLMVVSTAKISNEFSYANISTEYDYLTAGTELELTAIGVSGTGNSAPVPENAVWQISDETLGSIENGVFTAAKNASGDVTVSLVVDGKSVGQKELHIVVPDKLVFEKDNINVIYGVPTELPLIATYKGNRVAFNSNDINIKTNPEKIADINGVIFTGKEESNVRSAVVTAKLLIGTENISAEITVALYKEGEAVFDFDTATKGDRVLAWNRIVSNSTTFDEVTYQVIEPDEDMTVDYTFALDMTAIDIPERLQDIVYMLPGGDNPGATAWDFLLQLAERVSVLTEVKVVAQFDKNLDVDISELKVINEYFYMKSAEVDENNKLTIICGWIDQTAAIDPATANPICILSGIHLEPKEGAEWSSANQLSILNSGEVSYNIFLRANALYSFANIPANQEIYGLIPFDNKDVIIGGTTEKGASFGQVYTTFEDTFVLDKTNRQGWFAYENFLYYYVDNVALTGIQKLPCYEDPTKTYFYEFAEDGSLSHAMSGLFELDGNYYYTINGEPRTGWNTVGGAGEKNYYYFDPVTFAAVDGVQKIGGYTYTFTDHVLTRGEIVKDSIGYRYIWAGSWVNNGWVEIDGEMYFAVMGAGYFDTGLKKRYANDGNVYYYCFAPDGRWMQEYSGFYDYNGQTYLVEDGYVVIYPGLVKVGEYYYYFLSTDYMLKNTPDYWISKPNGLVKEARYNFEPDGRMILRGVKFLDPDNQPKHGFYEEEGKKIFYNYGAKEAMGLVNIKGDYYYIKSNGEAVCGTDYWVTRTNGLMEEGKYTFGDDGKMIIGAVPGEPEEPKQGIVEEEGEKVYYIEGEKTPAGLIFIGGNYYYVKYDGTLVSDTEYWVSKTNGLAHEGMYTFDKDGKLVVTVVMSEDSGELKNGIYEEDGKLFYYADGQKTYGGLVTVGEDTYYAKANGELVCGEEYWVAKTNGIAEEGLYTFDEQGRLVK